MDIRLTLPIFFNCIICTMAIVVFNTVSYGQIAEKYKDNLSKEKYTWCLTWEDSINSSRDLLHKANLYFQAGNIVLHRSRQLSRDYFEEALLIADSLSWDSMYFATTNQIAYLDIREGKFYNATPLLSNSLDFWNNISDSINIAETINLKGDLAYNSANYVNAIAEYSKALKIFSVLNPIQKLGKIYNNLAHAYLEIGDCQKVLELMEQYLDSQDRSNPEGWAVSAMVNAAKCYRITGNMEKWNNYRTVTDSIYISHDSYRKKAYGYLSRHYTSKVKGDFEASKMDLDSALFYTQKFDFADQLSYIYHSYVYHFYDTGQYNNILPFLDKMMETAQASNRNKLIYRAYKAYADYYKFVENYEEAFKFYEVSDSLYKLIYSEEVLTKIKYLDATIQREQSEQQISTLKEKNRLNELNIANERKLKGFLIVTILLLFIITAVITQFYRQRIKADKLLREKNKTISNALETNKTLLKEIHHRVKNNLQVVSSLLSLQARYNDQKEGNEAIKTAQSRVQAMSLLHLKLYNKEGFQSLSVKNYFEELIEDLVLTYSSTDKKIKSTTDIADITLDIESIIPLGLIVNELITNSLKHAFRDTDQPRLDFELSVLNGDILMSVQDNGPGFPFREIPESSNSLGMEIIKSFTEKLDGKISIDNSSGARIEIRFPHPD